MNGAPRVLDIIEFVQPVEGTDPFFEETVEVVQGDTGTVTGILEEQGELSFTITVHGSDVRMPKCFVTVHKDSIKKAHP